MNFQHQHQRYVITGHRDTKLTTIEFISKVSDLELSQMPLFCCAVAPINIAIVRITCRSCCQRVIENGEPPAVGVVENSKPETAVLFIMLSVVHPDHQHRQQFSFLVVKVIQCSRCYTRSPSEEVPRVRLSPSSRDRNIYSVCIRIICDGTTSTNKILF